MQGFCHPPWYYTEPKPGRSSEDSEASASARDRGNVEGFQSCGHFRVPKRVMILATSIRIGSRNSG